MKIVLVPVGPVEREVLHDLSGVLGPLFGREVSIAGGIGEPPRAWNPKRRQVLATVVLDAVLARPEATYAHRVLGVIDRDLYVPRLNFVFGVAGSGGAVVSLARLRQGFYGLAEDRGLFLRRVRVEAVHELGHTMGLGHCADPRCVMFFSNSLPDTDRKGPGFCALCRARLAHRGL